MEKLTKEIALQKIELIKEAATSSSEEATFIESSLQSRFIECAAAGKYSQQECAEIAAVVLQTGSINFTRWCY